MKYICPYCKKIICENVEESMIKEKYIQCPYCYEFMSNSNYKKENHKEER